VQLGRVPGTPATAQTVTTVVEERNLRVAFSNATFFFQHSFRSVMQLQLQ
jgi:hypothetical protein